MTDEFTKYRTTKIVKRAVKGISEMAAEGDERARVWRKAVIRNPVYGVYQTRTERRIPVVILEPLSS